MAIDGIRKGPPVAPPQTTGTTGVASNAPFQIERSADVAPIASVDGTSLADKVRSGQLDLAGFVEAKIEQSTAHLSHMSPTALADIKDMMRDKMMNDPLVSQWIFELTGQSTPKDE